MSERLYAEYLLRTGLDAGKVAAIVAGEQSSGTFISTPGESAELKERSGARVELLEQVTDNRDPPLTGSQLAGEPVSSWRLRLSWPLTNMGPSLPNVMATVAGNLFELKQVAGLKLMDVEFPASFAGRYPGPGFGIEGTRKLAGVEGRPLIGTIIKPSVGLNPQETAALVQELCDGGIDFIKDDELQADGPHCPFEERFRAVMAVIDRHHDKIGQKVMYAVNITGELDEMMARHDLVEQLGGTCIMVSQHSVGLTGFTALRRHSRLPIHAHRNGWGYLGRSRDNGWAYRAWQKFWRIAGADHVHVNGLANKFWEPDDSVIDSARECLVPIFPDKPCLGMPIFSSGQSVMQAAPTWAALRSPDLVYCAGGGIMAHPSGIAAGVRSLREAWDAAMAGVPLAEAARKSRLLAEAVETFG
jgi:ribulose-bisphosphate carboxylase large chain